MNRLVLVVVMSTICGTALLQQRTAEACSHPLGASSPFLVGPADGAADVPLNTVLKLHWPGGGLTFGGGSGSSNAGEFYLRTAAGDEVLFTREISEPWGAGDVPTVTVQLTPSVPLSPMTTYEVVYVAPSIQERGVGSFTTGASIDDLAPEVPAIAGVETSTPHFCGQSEFGCCESHIVLDATITLAPTSEPVLYDVLDGTTRIAIDRPGPLDGMLFCDAGYASFHDTPFAGHPATWLASGPSRQLSIVARDVAGHASAPVSVTVAGDCGLVGAGVDAGPGGDGAGTAADAAAGAGGCQVAGTPGGRGATGLLWGPLAFMLALSLRRRRRLAELALVALGACDSATPVTTIPLPTGPVCDVPLVPRTLADGLACSGIVFVDDAQVYWSSEAGISGANKCGGAPEVAIADSPHTLVSILDGGDSWYTLSFAGEVRRTSKTDPGQSDLLGDGFRSAYHMEMDGDDLLLSAEGRCLNPSMPDCGFQRSMLWRVHGDGSPPVAVIVEGDGQIFDFALVGDWIYITGYLNDGMPGLRRMRPDGSGLEFVTHDGETVQAEDLLADPSNGELFMHSFEGLRALRGDDLRLVSTEVSTDRGLALDSHFVYALGSDGRLVRVPRVGGPAVTLLEGSNVWSFAIDAGAIYAYDCGDPAGRVVTFRR